MARTRNPRTIAGDQAAPPPGYHASWPDRLADRVEKWPGPEWVYYLGAGVLLFALGLLLAQRDFGGTARYGEAARYYALFTGLLTSVYLLKHYFRSYGRVAMRAFAPAFRETDSVTGQVRSLAECTFLFTNSPALPTLLWTLAGMLLVGILIALGAAPFQRLGIAASSISYAFNITMELAVWGIVGASAYTIQRTLRLVSHFYVRHARVSLFQLQPLYAFSALTMRYALGAVVGPFVFFGVERDLLAGWPSVMVAMSGLVVGLLLFLAPLNGAHRLLAAEKNALLASNSQRLREVLEKLHAAAEDVQSGNAATIHYLLQGLQQEREVLEAIPTWPWRPGLLRGLLTALLLPLVLWLTQLLLGRLLER